MVYWLHTYSKAVTPRTLNSSVLYSVQFLLEWQHTLSVPSGDIYHTVGEKLSCFDSTRCYADRTPHFPLFCFFVFIILAGCAPDDMTTLERLFVSKSWERTSPPPSDSPLCSVYASTDGRTHIHTHKDPYIHTCADINTFTPKESQGSLPESTTLSHR